MEWQVWWCLDKKTKVIVKRSTSSHLTLYPLYPLTCILPVQWISMQPLTLYSSCIIFVSHFSDVAYSYHFADFAETCWYTQTHVSKHCLDLQCNYFCLKSLGPDRKMPAVHQNAYPAATSGLLLFDHMSYFPKCKCITDIQGAVGRWQTAEQKASGPLAVAHWWTASDFYYQTGKNKMRDNELPLIFNDSQRQHVKATGPHVGRWPRKKIEKLCILWNIG